MIKYMAAFELFPTEVSSGKNPTQVTTKATGIKCTINDSNLLQELFTQAFTKLAIKIAHIHFIPSGIAMQIGADKYQTMIYNNNKFLTNRAATMIAGITPHMLDLKIEVNAPGKPTCQMTIKEIFLDVPWCHQVEPTEKQNHIILITDKTAITNTRLWLDDNVEGLFTRYITCNLAYKPDKEYAIPQCMDKIPTTQARATYAETLSKKHQTNTAMTTNATQYCRSPPQVNHKPTLFTFDAKEFPLLEQTNVTNNVNDKKPPLLMNNNATIMTTTSMAINQVDLKALQ